MKRIAFYDTKPYDRKWFDILGEGRYNIKYLENKLNEDTAKLAAGCDGVVAFVNDDINAGAIDVLSESGVGVLAMRCAGYNNIDFKAAYKKLHVVRVPVYSPYAVAEHAMALLLTLNRKIHRAYIRTRDYNFSLNGLTGFDLHGKTVGVIGTGQIGRIFIEICRGFGMNVIAYDPYPAEGLDVRYVDRKELFRTADIISLHCPLTESSRHIIDKDALSVMKDGVFIINTSRGALIESEALMDALKAGKVGGAGLDVYEEESDLFFEDYSDTIIQDDVLARIISMPNVIVTSHQAFLTSEALYSIAEVTLNNLDAYFSGAPLENEICYRCGKVSECAKKSSGRCF